MRRLLVLALTLGLLSPAAAHAGTRISPRPDCPGQYQQLDAKHPGAYRAAVLCLMSAIRHDQHLNRLGRDARLQTAGQRWAHHLGKTGRTDHGKSYAEIPKRIAKAGYPASAVNEGLGLGGPSDTPYEVMRNMMTDFACTEILDPRFRDAGVGVDLGKLRGFGRGIHVVVEFGLARNASPPSGKRRPAATCPHGLPAPPTSPVTPTPDRPVVGDSDITVRLKCIAKRACTFSASLKLVHEGSTATRHVDALAPGTTTDAVFTYTPEAIAAEQKAKHPSVDLAIHTTKPFSFDDVFSVGI